MNLKDFRKLSGAVKGLTPHQRQVLMDRLQPAAQGSASYNLVEIRVPGNTTGGRSFATGVFQ